MYTSNGTPIETRTSNDAGLSQTFSTLGQPEKATLHRFTNECVNIRRRNANAKRTNLNDKRQQPKRIIAARIPNDRIAKSQQNDDGLNDA